MAKIFQNKTAKTDENVVDIFTGHKIKNPENNPIIRLAPELDGLEMLYSNDANKGKMFSMKILCWALRRNGEVEAMVPWLGKLASAEHLKDPLNGHWEGFYDSLRERLFYEAPVHKIVELEGAAGFFQDKTHNFKDDEVIQEIPDNIGTHAIMTDNAFQRITLSHITSWRLFADGQIKAMTADTDKINATPVLPGDESLYAVQDDPKFKYFFHHLIANKIKSGDSEAMAAFSHLLDQ